MACVVSGQCIVISDYVKCFMITLFYFDKSKRGYDVYLVSVYLHVF